MADTSSKRQNMYIFCNICDICDFCVHKNISQKPLPFTSYRSCTPVNNFSMHRTSVRNTGFRFVSKPQYPVWISVIDATTTYNPKGCPYQLSTSYNLRFQRYCVDKILKVKVTMARSKVKSRSYHDVCTAISPSQCPYQVSTFYTLWLPRYSLDKKDIIGRG